MPKQVIYLQKNLRATPSLQFSCSKGSIEFTARKPIELSDEHLTALQLENYGFRLCLQDGSIVVSNPEPQAPPVNPVTDATAPATDQGLTTTIPGVVEPEEDEEELDEEDL